MGRIRVDVACRDLKDRRGTWLKVTLSLLGIFAGLLIAETSIAQSTLPPHEMRQLEQASFAYFSCVRSKVTPAHRRYPTPYAAAQAVFDSCRKEEARLRALGVSDAMQNKFKEMMTKTHFVDIWRK
jgi:hypothetical protein